MYQNKFLFLLIFIALFYSCNKTDDNPADTFDRKQFLQHAADELIIPSYNNFLGASSSLKSAVDNFVENTNLNALENLQNEWKNVAEASLMVTTFNFGPAETATGNLTQDIATFPVNASQIENFVSQMGNENFNPLNNFARDTRGIYGVEYLIFDIDQNQNIILDRFTGSDAENYKEYLQAIATDLNNRVAQVSNDWNNFREVFINNDGTSAGSSMSEYYNQFLIGFENIKNFKLGIPLGLRAGQSGTEPDLIEALYSGFSVDFIKLNFEQIEKVYFGITQNGTNGIGFDDYIKEIQGGEELLSETIAQLENINSALAQFSNTTSFYEQINSNNLQAAESVHFEMSKWTRFVKSDLSSLLGISITFSSGDGD